MRADMYKVIVERPRKGKDWTPTGARRRFDWDGPAHAGMRAGIGHSHLNENLRPLERFLHKQVGRPWNKVWSEIAANIDRRNTVQEHIYTHIRDFIAVQVEWNGDHWVDLRDRDRFRYRGGGLGQPLYVDPRTGLVRRNPGYNLWRRERRVRAAAQAAEIASRRRPLGEDRWHLKLDGEWYEVLLAPLPPSHVRYMDSKALARLEQLYGAPKRYALSKRQLSRREIVAHGLPVRRPRVP